MGTICFPDITSYMCRFHIYFFRISSVVYFRVDIWQLFHSALATCKRLTTVSQSSLYIKQRGSVQTLAFKLWQAIFEQALPLNAWNSTLPHSLIKDLLKTGKTHLKLPTYLNLKILHSSHAWNIIAVHPPPPPENF